MKKAIILPLSLIIFLLMVTCDKNKDENGNDQNLQLFWKLEGFYDSDNNPVYEPQFNSDTIFQYEVNLKFIWNAYTQRYEIQGQGPFDIYWGEFSVNEHKLEFYSLETTGLIGSSAELADYDSIYFNALRSTSIYTLNYNELTLYFDQGRKKMVFTPEENQYLIFEESLTAEINDMSWKGDKDYTTAYVEYNYDTDLYNLSLGAESHDTLADGLRYDISIVINRQPANGRYYFNNSGAVIESDGGILGTCTGRYKDQYTLDTRSTSGYVEITIINRSFIKGNFWFDAEDVGDNAGITNRITGGKFLISLSSPSEWFQPYDFGY